MKWLTRDRVVPITEDPTLHSGFSGYFLHLCRPAKIVHQNAKADQKHPQWENDEAIANIVASEQEWQGEHIPQDRQPTRHKSRAHRDHRCGGHEYASHLDHVYIHDSVNGGAREVERTGVGAVTRAV
jgi:hypothetical protein